MPARPAPPAPVSVDEIFKRFFDSFAGAPLASTKALALQILLPTDACYKNERVVGAGAYDDIIKKSIAENEAALVGTTPAAPFADTGELLRLVVATAASGRGATAGGGAVPGIDRSSSGGSGGGGVGGRDGMLAEALDTTKLPTMKGEDGHEKIAHLPVWASCRLRKPTPL